jgi:hypothetical protein
MKKQLCYSFSTLKTVCFKDKDKAKLAKEISKVTCPECNHGIDKLISTGGN